MLGKANTCLLILPLSLSLIFQANPVQCSVTAPPLLDIPEQINDFKTCAIMSLKRTPQLQRTRMEIDIRRLDEDDSRWAYSPNLSLSSNYYFSEADTNLTFNVSNYKPWEPYFSLQANKLISEIVMLNHVKATSLALQKIADTLLHVIALDQIETHYKKIVTFSSKRLEHAQQRQKSAETMPLELELEQRKKDLVEAEYLGNTTEHDILLNGLSISLNLPDPQIIQIHTDPTIEQIIGSSDSLSLKTTTRPEKSFEQKVMSIKLKLQEKKITLAYSKYMPSFSFGIRTPDIINVSVDENQDYFYYVGLSIKLWDGKKRSRDITRQKLILRQMQYEKQEVENKSALEWLQAIQQYNLAKNEFTFSQSAEKFKLLQTKKKKFDYDRGATNLPDLLNHKISYHRDKIRTILKEYKFNKARLRLRHLSGQLLNDTVKISFSDNAYE